MSHDAVRHTLYAALSHLVLVADVEAIDVCLSACQSSKQAALMRRAAGRCRDQGADEQGDHLDSMARQHMSVTDATLAALA